MFYEILRAALEPHVEVGLSEVESKNHYVNPVTTQNVLHLPPRLH